MLEDVSGNTVVLTDANALTLGASTVAGTLTATATDNAAAGDDLTVAAGATVRSTGGNVILQAGDNLTLGAGSLAGRLVGAGRVAVWSWFAMAATTPATRLGEPCMTNRETRSKTFVARATHKSRVIWPTL